MKVPILRLRDKYGKEIVIPAIRGPRGPAGDGTGDMVAEVYDPQGKAADIFQYVDDTVAPMNEHREGLAETVEQMQAMLEEQVSLIEELSARVEELENGIVEPDPEPDVPDPDEPGGGDSPDEPRYCSCGALIGENGCTEMNGPGCDGWTEEVTLTCDGICGQTFTGTEYSAGDNCPECGEGSLW